MNRRGFELQEMPRFTDLIVQRDTYGRFHGFARNASGLHVPIETLSVETLRRACLWDSWYLAFVDLEAA